MPIAFKLCQIGSRHIKRIPKVRVLQSLAFKSCLSLELTLQSSNCEVQTNRKLLVTSFSYSWPQSSYFFEEDFQDLCLWHVVNSPRIYLVSMQSRFSNRNSCITCTLSKHSSRSLNNASYMGRVDGLYVNMQYASKGPKMLLYMLLLQISELMEYRT